MPVIYTLAQVHTKQFLLSFIWQRCQYHDALAPLTKRKDKTIVTLSYSTHYLVSIAIINTLKVQN